MYQVKLMFFPSTGKANLLMNKKGRFEQFRSLIHNCEFGLGEKETTCMDLQVHFKVFLTILKRKFSKLMGAIQG